jgi:hypothetical protein
MPATKKMDSSTTREREQLPIAGPFRRISEPGCFVINHTGDLLRVPDDAVELGRSPTIDIVSKNPWMVTKISNDPYLPLRSARMLAADLDLYINF